MPPESCLPVTIQFCEVSMQRTLALFLVFALASPAFAWNDKGHMVVARLAWTKLTDEQRSQVTAILKKHPHYEEFLIARKPEGFSVNEWAFMRAATWGDWIRNRHAEEFSHPTWHYINYPVTFPGGGVDPDKHQPPEKEENAVWAMNQCLEKNAKGSDEEKAVYLTWLFHLVGDIHQPQHCVALFSEKYPEGDRGGNLIRIRVDSDPLNLHSFWDGLLGRELSAPAIGKDVAEIQAIMIEKATALKPDMDDHKTPDSWAREGAELARKAVYLDGELLKPRGEGAAADFIQVPADYAPAAGRLARVQIGKAGARLAEKLGELVK
jgi:hypothetical protein